MKAHSITLATHPEAAPHLAALFTACAGGETPIEGRTASGAREKLAAIVGGPVADLLRSGGPIRVKPKNTTTWAVVDGANNQHADYDLARVIRAEMKAQKLTETKLARQSGCAQKSINHILSTERAPAWWLVRAVVAGLGKDLHWLADRLAEPAP